MSYRLQRGTATLAFGLMVLASALLYPALPDTMATHWNAAGQVDGTLPKAIGVSVIPAVTVFTVGLLYVAPRIDPRQEHVEAFRGAYEWLVAGVTVFLGYVHGLTLAWNLGVTVPIGRALAPAVAVLFYGIGILLARVESNWFVGIRTPWTLSDEEIWERTHRRGALAFKAAGGLMLLGVVWPRRFAVIMIGVTIAVGAYTVAYSFLAYRRKHGSS